MPTWSAYALAVSSCSWLPTLELPIGDRSYSPESSMTQLLDSIRAEYGRNDALAERALDQVPDALYRSLAHASDHVGQIVHLALAHRGADGEYLSIAHGGSAAYHAAPLNETPGSHAAKLRGGRFPGDTKSAN